MAGVAKALRFLALLPAAWPAAVSAQPADLPIPPAKAADLPGGVSVVATPAARVYSDARGLVLYGMDMRTLLRAGPDPSQHCRDACMQVWEPLLAPAGSKPNIQFPKATRSKADQLPDGFVDPRSAPDWTVIQGPRGPQWVYKGWHMVFTRRGSQAGKGEHDGAEDFTWNTLKFVPPTPKLEAPAHVAAKFLDGAYALTDAEGRVLFTGTCTQDCPNWRPLAGGLVSRGIGKWSVSRKDDTPQWTYTGKPVFVSREGDPAALPAGAALLRP